MKRITFPSVMIAAALTTGIITLALVLICRYYSAGWLLALTITFGTTCYHFSMRLLVGALVPNRFDYRNRWFQPKGFEVSLYRKLQVKRWKDHMPIYDPRLFSLQENTLEQVVRNMCQAEVVHEIIVLCSFIPLLFSVALDSFWEFLITSVLAAGLDTVFVMMQRYNRPRLVRILEKQTSRK